MALSPQDSARRTQHYAPVTHVGTRVERGLDVTSAQAAARNEIATERRYREELDDQEPERWDGLS